MPISKDGNRYYTKEQYIYARYECSALEYAQSRGYPLVRDGRYYHMEGHDSMVFAPNGMWFWNSRGLQGKAMDFMIHYEGKSVLDAVLELNEGRPGSEPMPRHPEVKQADSKPYIPKAVQLPEKAPQCRRLYAYLCGTRKVEKSVVTELVQKNLLYEGQGTSADGKAVYHNAVFIYYDYEQKTVGAYLRGLCSDKPFKKDLSGSDKSFGWLMHGTDEYPDTVYIFEAAIDAASHLSLARLEGRIEEAADRLSLEGLAPRPLKNYLKHNPSVKNIVFCLDNDEAGRSATQRLRELIADKNVSVQIPPAGKDWNESLQIRYENLKKN